jgi:hypothetical protein
MHASAEPGGLARLTYCTNIHPGEGLGEVRALLEEHVLKVRSAFSPDAPFGVGLRLSARAVHELAQGHELPALRSWLSTHGMYVFTLNGFPYGGFHQERVKERVYAPDWASSERLSYTRALARVLAELLPDEPGLYGSVSTVPLGYRAHLTLPEARARAAHALVSHAAELWALEQEFGKRIVLALEPEPFCALERTSDVLAFFAEHLFSQAAASELAARTGLHRSQAKDALHRHLGVCLDACHAAVVFEDPLESVAQLEAFGIFIAKLQVSSGLEVQLGRGRAHVLHELSRFADDVYLHPVFERTAQGTRAYLDLPEALAHAREHPELERTWRIHFHVPVFAERLGSFSGTRASLSRLLQRQRERPFTAHLEVETYTWDVLPQEHRTSSVTDAIVRELAWTRDEVGL